MSADEVRGKLSKEIKIVDEFEFLPHDQYSFQFHYGKSNIYCAYKTYKMFEYFKSTPYTELQKIKWMKPKYKWEDL